LEKKSKMTGKYFHPRKDGKHITFVWPRHTSACVASTPKENRLILLVTKVISGLKHKQYIASQSLNLGPLQAHSTAEI